MAEQTVSAVKASFDVDSNEGKIRVFNAQNGASESLKNLNDGQVIECNGALQYTDKVDAYGKGEDQDGKISVLFGTDGTSYAGISDTVGKATEKLIDLFNSTGVETLNVKVVKQKSNSDREFLNLQVSL